MRTDALASFLFCSFAVVACIPLSGGSDGGGTGTSSSKNPTSPTASDEEGKTPPPAGEPAQTESSAAICSRYVTCIAKTSPSLVGEVSDTYGKSGSCWDEMSAGECEDACRLGLEQAGCPTCDPTASSCIGESCKSNDQCAQGELCAAKTCIVDAHMKKCASSSSCPSPYECLSVNGEGTTDMRCVIPCKGDITGNSACPAGFICNGGGCVNSDSLPNDP